MGLKDFVKFLLTKIKIETSHINTGKNCYIGLNVNIIHSGGVILGNDVIIRPSTDIYATPKGAKIIIGNNSEIGNHSTISANRLIEIEDGVLTGPHVFIADHNHNYNDPKQPIYKQGVKALKDTRVHIGAGTWIGTNAVIVGNVSIGRNCVVGANSVVTKDIPDYSVAVGIPAKVIKHYDFQRKEWIKLNR